ncbi:VlmB-like protein [Allokutzneria sp. A3M-2-11 16]|uniref:VlmB-like protein n=1 Tax=Allokutzneria sp. A3M-2-11 16 TaxID=2962043 RepID=UPI0020B788C4|nr:VlmB-like protein [Allokutzneria sp. A3M-2-11 16]MCP3803322.1 VlmB-like protein [Allokutzneria sp. A3M-2-11 16]
MSHTIAGQQQLVELGPEQCGLEFWHSEVIGGQVLGQVNGHRPDAGVPEFLREPGPLRDSLIAEFAFQAIAEEKATRSLTSLIATAPDLATMEFYASQLMDEARHGHMYRSHLVELGVEPASLNEVITAYAGAAAEMVLSPVQSYGLDIMDKHRDFHRGVVILTVLVEGVIAPITELSEQKWRPLHPAAAQLQRSANTDEMRHLSVGSTVIRRHLTDNPERRAELLEIVDAGRALWESLPMAAVQLALEGVFQQGLEQQAELVGDYEIWAGKRLLDSTPEERVELAQRWSREIQDERLAYMLLTD